MLSILSEMKNYSLDFSEVSVTGDTESEVARLPGSTQLHETPSLYRFYRLFAGVRWVFISSIRGQFLPSD